MLAIKITETELILKDQEKKMKLTWKDILKIIEMMIYQEPGGNIQIETKIEKNEYY